MAFYGRGNYHGTVERVLRNHPYEQFRGANFQDAWVSAYRPDITVDDIAEVTVGGTVFELTPVTGGETEDTLRVYLPDLGAEQKERPGQVLMAKRSGRLVRHGIGHGMDSGLSAGAE